MAVPVGFEPKTAVKWTRRLAPTPLNLRCLSVHFETNKHG